METKKYIIEIPDNTAWIQWVKVSDKDGHVCFDFKDPEDLTPYIEPDLDAVNKEVHDKCMSEAEDLAYKLYSPKIDEAYQRGLNDAWDAARKIVLSREDGGLFGYEERKAVFGCGNYMALKTFLAPEAIKKIRQYEQEKEEEIKAGNEVKGGDEKYIVLQKYVNNIDELMVVLFNRRDGQIGTWHMYNAKGAIFEKTGRHFPEIVEVLRKMKEEES